MPTLPNNPPRNAFPARDDGLEGVYPPVLSLLASALLQPSPDLTQVERCISMDAALTAFVMDAARTAPRKSALPGTRPVKGTEPDDAPARIAPRSISEALTALGIRELLRMVLTLTALPGVPHGETPRGSAASASDGKPAPASVGAHPRHWELALRRAVAVEESLRHSAHPEQAGEAYVHALLGEAPGESLIASANDPLFSSLVDAASRWAQAVTDAQEDERETLERHLTASLGLTAGGMETLRERCEARFQAAVTELRHAEPDFFGTLLPRLQGLLILARDLDFPHNGLARGAERMRRHLARYWGVEDWEICLCLPQSRLFLFLRARKGEAVQHTAPLSPSQLPWSKGQDKYRLSVDGRYFGQFRCAAKTPDADQHMAGADSVPPVCRPSLSQYLHFVSIELERFHRESSEKSRHAETLSVIPVCIARVDAAGRFVDANPAFLQFFSLTSLPRMNASDLLRERCALDVTKAWRAFTGGTPSEYVRVFTLPDLRYDNSPGEKSMRQYLLRFARCTARRQETGEEAPTDVLIVITEYTQADYTTPDAATRDAVLEAIPEVILLLGADGRIEWAPAGKTALRGHNFFTLASPFSSFFQDSWDATLLASLTGTTLIEAALPPLLPAPVPSTASAASAEPDDKKPHGESLAASLWQFSLTPFSGLGFAGGCLAVGRPLAAARGNARRGTISSADAISPEGRDALTGLYGFSQCHTILERASDTGWGDGGNTGILVVDLEAFELVNEMYGYQTGDAILRRVADALRSVTRPGIDMVGRLAGDHFLVIMPEADSALLESTAARLQEEVRGGCRGAVAADCGMILMPPDHAYQPYLEAARRACREAAQLEEHRAWALLPTLS